MAKVCKKCGRKIGFGEYSYNGECENCNKGISTNLTNNAKNTTNNDDTSGCIFGFIFIAIIIFIVILIGNSVKQDTQKRKEKGLREFNTQLHQDPSTWDKKQQDRYDSFTKWDWDNNK